MTTIQKQAKIFRAGIYPKKGKDGADFVVTIDDLHRIAANTKEFPIIFAHDETGERLDFGTGSDLRVEGDELHGTLNLDEEAAPFIEKNGLKSLSAGILYDKSALRETSFTRRPHIADMGTFHDDAATLTSDCAWFNLSEEDPDVNSVLDLLATFAGKTISTASAEKINAAHDALSTLHPDCCPANNTTVKMSDTTPADERKTNMSIWDRLLGKSDATQAEKDAAKAEFHEAIKEAVPAPVDTTAQFAELNRRSDLLDAKTFAQEMLMEGKILPTQIHDVVVEFSDAAEDDRLAPRKVTFSQGTETKTGTRVEKIKAKYTSAPRHRLNEELMLDGDMAALFNRNTQQETAEQKAAKVEADVVKMRELVGLKNNGTGK